MKDNRHLSEQAGDATHAISETEIETRSMFLDLSPRPTHLYLIIMMALFLGEAFVMLTLSTVPTLPIMVEALVDAVLLSAIAWPFLHFLGFKPMQMQIEKRKQSEAQKDRLIVRLEQAISEVNALQVILPICAMYKKARKDHEAWEAVERYLSQRAGQRVPLGICPDCMKRLHPEISSQGSKGTA